MHLTGVKVVAPRTRGFVQERADPPTIQNGESPVRADTR
jgi:hypothetical protein